MGRREGVCGGGKVERREGVWGGKVGRREGVWEEKWCVGRRERNGVINISGEVCEEC